MIETFLDQTVTKILKIFRMLVMEWLNKENETNIIGGYSVDYLSRWIEFEKLIKNSKQIYFI